ncbi:MAG: serine/threonine-protein kinase [candidate division Zixibacteria bacterium]|nr:serine/threonine-protein kinase [candidate division Zixibacteria bacterium]
MALRIGTRLGPYEILAPAGAGGMGEVYKACDTRLNRTVAVKVLPEAIADIADLRSRFDREAKAISSLNHANICTLYDVGHQDGIDFLVMEYLEGETLAERLKKGALPLADLLAFAMQIADALHKAHNKGLIHRDLKPANIMLTKAGAKVLDFGLAKQQMPGGPVSGPTGITMTTPVTGEGTILGTLQYMSPEQLDAKEVDGRSDIFSFGAILYEMATGNRAFEGKSQASLIASIMKEQPRPISQVVPLSPPMLDRVIGQCLEKDAEDRWQSAGDLRQALQWISEGGSQVGIPVTVSARRRRRERVLWGALVILAVVCAALGVLSLTRITPVPKVARWVIPPAPGLNSITWPKLSPDGTMIAFQAADTMGQTGIYIRPLNSLEPHLLVKVATSGSRPFWSPESKQLAFFDAGQLKKVSIAGGLAQIVCEAGGADGTWGSKGIILFDGGSTDSIRQVPASGGVPAAASRIDRSHGEHMAAWPCFLPDGEHFLFLADRDSSAGEYALKVGSVHSMDAKILMGVNSRVEYAGGYVLYLKNELLVAHAFDPEKLQFIGEPVPLSGSIAAIDTRGLFSASGDGTLIYQRGESGDSRSIIRLTRHGDSATTIGPPGRYGDFSLSPDNSRIAYGLLADQGNSMDVWVRDLKRGIASRLTFGPTYNSWPVWNPDGTKVIFNSSRAQGHFSVWQRNANGTGTDEKVFALDTCEVGVTSISRDGATAVLEVYCGNNFDIWMLTTATGKAEPLLAQPYFEMRGVLSPNGRFLAYESSETGRSEIYIRELSPTGGKWQVSADRGLAPQWRADGRELFYITPGYDFMAVPVSYDRGLDIGTPVRLFSHRYIFSRYNTLMPYAVTNDGQHFLILAPAEQGNATEFIVVQNWAEELKKN